MEKFLLSHFRKESLYAFLLLNNKTVKPVLTDKCNDLSGRDKKCAFLFPSLRFMWSLLVTIKHNTGTFRLASFISLTLRFCGKYVINRKMMVRKMNK